MKKLFFLLISCLVSINIYAKEDTTSYNPFKNASVISQTWFNPMATVKENREAQFLGNKEMKNHTVVLYNWRFQKTNYQYKIFLIRDTLLKKNVIIPSLISCKKGFAWSLLIPLIISFLSPIFQMSKSWCYAPWNQKIGDLIQDLLFFLGVSVLSWIIFLIFLYILGFTYYFRNIVVVLCLTGLSGVSGYIFGVVREYFKLWMSNYTTPPVNHRHDDGWNRLGEWSQSGALEHRNKN